MTINPLKLLRKLRNYKSLKTMRLDHMGRIIGNLHKEIGSLTNDVWFLFEEIDDLKRQRLGR